MKIFDVPKFQRNQWLKVGGKLVTRIIKDTGKGISQDGRGDTKDFPPYSKKYELRKKAGKATPKGVSANKTTSPPNLRLTGVMLNSLKVKSATNESVTLNYRDGVKFEGNAKNKRNVYGLNDKNVKFVRDFFAKEIDQRIIKFNKKKIIIDLKV